MELDMDPKKPSGIMLSCYYKQNREGEHFVPEHTLQYTMAGSLVLNDGQTKYPSHIGSLRFIRRNQLLKFIKQPPDKGEFRSLSIYLDQRILKNFSLEYGIVAKKKDHEVRILEIDMDKLLKNYMESLLMYHKTNGPDSQLLMDLKLKEGVLLLLRTNPELKNVLFDFAEPHKIDLEGFMIKNYHFNVKLQRFAYLTGRSLATFKRDFEKVFGTAPGQWIRQKRLQEAHYLITKKGMTASDIYLDLGFEDLSHFSHTFKKQFGASPSKIIF
tara:strand:+ start:22422 stop:23234 length:813 start_codon:yes stop_codon:yes gene_type:complete